MQKYLNEQYPANGIVKFVFFLWNRVEADPNIYYQKCFECTVKPVYNDDPRDPKIVAVVDRWSLLRGHLCYKSSEWNLTIVAVYVIDRWSLAQVWLYSFLIVLMWWYKFS